MKRFKNWDLYLHSPHTCINGVVLVHTDSFAFASILAKNEVRTC